MIQIECVGTCDERNRGKWQKGLFVEDWPVWYLNGVRKLMRWIEQNRPVPHASDLFWKPYDSGRASGSYGLQNGVRLPCGRFNSFAAIRLNQEISRCAFRMITPSGSAAVERWICRKSCTKRCL